MSSKSFFFISKIYNRKRLYLIFFFLYRFDLCITYFIIWSCIMYLHNVLPSPCTSLVSILFLGRFGWSSYAGWCRWAILLGWSSFFREKMRRTWSSRSLYTRHYFSGLDRKQCGKYDVGFDKPEMRDWWKLLLNPNHCDRRIENIWLCDNF